MSAAGFDLIAAALDHMRETGILASWSRSVLVSAGQGQRRIADIYRIGFGEHAAETDREGVFALLERHGRTALGHDLEIRMAEPRLATA
jgi:hypothetical protein